MSLTDREIYDRLLVAIGADSGIENIYVRRAAAKATVSEVRALLNEHAHELAEEIRAAGCQEVNWCGCPIAADLIDPKKES